MELRVSLGPLPELLWLRRQAVRRLIQGILPGQSQSPGHLQRHLDATVWAFLKLAVRVPGDFASIEDAVTHAPTWPPMTILVGSGQHVGELLLTKPVTLLGDESGSRAKFTAPGTATPVTFAPDASTAAPPRLVGFEISSDAPCILASQGPAVVVRCIITSRQNSGMVVSGEATASISSSTFTGNGKPALFFKEKSTGNVQHCTFTRNKHSAVLSRHESSPRILGSSLSFNRRAALVFRECTAGTVRDNLFERNEGCGIELHEEASPLVEANTFSGHTMPTIMLWGRSSARLASNIIKANLGLGIVVGGCSSPEVVENQLHDNRKHDETAPMEQRRIDSHVRVLQSSRRAEAATAKLEAVEPQNLAAVAAARVEAASAWAEAVDAAANLASTNPAVRVSTSGQKRAAILVQGESTPTIKRNSLARNEGYGILVCDTSRPLLEGNQLLQHKRPAMALRDKTECVVRRNKFFDNDGFGIIVCQSAAPTISDNEFCRHGRPAILIKDSATGTLSGNHLVDNRSLGILVTGAAEPCIKENHCKGECLPHIAFRDHAKGIVRHNLVMTDSGEVLARETEGWLSVAVGAQPDTDDRGSGQLSPEDKVAEQDGLTLQSAKNWAERILSRGGDDSDSDEEDDGGFLVFAKAGAGPKAKGTGWLYSSDAQRTKEHKLPAAAQVFEWADLDEQAREFNKRRLAGERVPFPEQDALASERKKLRLEEGVEFFDDWLLRQAQGEDIKVQVVLEGNVPADEVEFHVEPTAPPLPASPPCIRALESDSDEDEEDEDDPADGTGTFLDYLSRRLLANLPRTQVLQIDPRDLGDSQDDAVTGSFHELVQSPAPRDPDEVELEAAKVGPLADEKGEEDEPHKAAVPSWEAYFSSAAELLYYSPHVKADYAPLLTRCLSDPQTLRKFFQALFFGTVPDAVSILGGLDAERHAFSRIRSLVSQPLGKKGVKRRSSATHTIPVKAAPVDGYLKARGSNPPRLWVSGLAQRLESVGAAAIVDAAKVWFRDAVEYLLSDPKSADTEGDFFVAWLRAAHRDVYDDIDRSDPAEISRAQWVPSCSHPKSKKHRHKVKDIEIPNIDEAFEELKRFDPSKRVSTKRERVLAMILLECFELRMVDLAAILRVADAVLVHPPASKVVVVLYAGGDHANSVADFWKARGFSSGGLPGKGVIGKEDWEDDEQRALNFPAYLHNFGSLFPVR